MSLTTTTSGRPAPVDLPPNASRAAIGIGVVLLAQLMLMLDATVVNVGLPHIGHDLGFSTASLSWVLNAYALAFGGLLVLGGRLGDAFGRRRLFVLGLVVFTIASAVGGLATTPGMLLAARAAQGLGAAMAAPSTLALLTTSAPDEPARLRALALFGAVSSGGFSVGLLLGGVVTDVASWRWTLFINVPIGLVAVLLSRRYVEETATQPGRFDLVGAVTATGGAVSIVWALIGAPEHGWLALRTLLGLALGAVLLAALVATERRVTHPLIQPAVVRDPRRVGALAAMAFLIAGNLSMFYLVVQFGQIVLGFGPLAAGLSFLPLSLTIFGLSRVTPRLVARFGPTPLLMLGTAVAVVSYTWLSQVSTTSTYVGDVLGPLLLVGVAMGLSFMPITSIVLGNVASEHAGSASGLLQTTQQLGSAVGIAVIVSVYAAGSVPGQFVPGLRGALLTSAAFALVAFVVASTLHLRGQDLTTRA